MSGAVITAKTITKSAKSTLAFALKCLPKQRQDDMITFYAFCRVVDDIADSEVLSIEQKTKDLTYWREGLVAMRFEDDSLGQSVIEVAERNEVDSKLLLAIVDGCMDDLTPVTFDTWKDLQDYTWKVACAVGLASIKIFGCKNPQSDEYAVKLGHALQLTNILRDVGHDWDFDARIYLPVKEMEDFGYSVEKLKKKVYDDSFVKMMEHHTKRARGLFAEADALLPQDDAKALMSARIMGQMYQSLLVKIEKNRFNVFDQVHKLSITKKLFLLLSFSVKACFAK